MYVYVYTCICIFPTWMSYVTRVDESCHTYEWTISPTWISHFLCIKSCHTYEWVMSPISSPIQMSHAAHRSESRPLLRTQDIHRFESWHTCMNGSCCPCEWVTSPTCINDVSAWMNHVVHMNESCPHMMKRSYEWVTSSRHSIVYTRTDHVTHV